MVFTCIVFLFFFFFSSRRRHTRSLRDWSSDVCSSDLGAVSRPGAPVSGIAALIDEARQQYRHGNHAQAEAVCRQILARDSANTDTLNLAGVIAQATGRHQVAVKMLGRAVESDPSNAACHYNIGVSCRALERLDEAARHFTKAIELGLS